MELQGTSLPRRGPVDPAQPVCQAEAAVRYRSAIRVVWVFLASVSQQQGSVCRGHRAVVITSTTFGVLSATGGFIASYYLNLPTGACIVLTSTALFAAAALYRTLRARAD